MKLLLDANLSPKLVDRLATLFPELSHVREHGLGADTSDLVIWQFAKANGFTIITADLDFVRLAEEHGTPPMIVRLENCNYPLLGRNVYSAVMRSASWN